MAQPKYGYIVKVHYTGFVAHLAKPELFNRHWFQRV